jgi:sulfoacetaldehyde acetyltransferase
MVAMTAAEAVVESLRVEGVKHLFGIPGSCMLEILDVLYDSPDIQFISTRHEQVAAHMADGYARVSGTPGVCLTTNGPGATNLVTGIAGAMLAHSPVIAITGAPMTSQIYRDSFQEIDQVSLFKPITKWSVQVNRAERIPEIFRHAFRVAMAGKKGPVHIDLPRDLLYAKMDVEIQPKERYRPTGRVGGDPQAVSAAVNLLLTAERPVIVAGGGVLWSEATAEVLAFAECLTIPVATSYGRNDAVPSDHPLAVGPLGRGGWDAAIRLVREADVILAAGSRLSHFTTYYGYEFIPRGAKIIQIEIDPKELGRNYPVAVGILGDVKTVLQEMIRLVEAGGRRPRRQGRRRAIQAARGEWLAEREKAWSSSHVPIKPQRVYKELNRVLPKDAVVTLDAGSACGFAYPLLDFSMPRSFIPPLDFGCVGVGYPTGLGAKVARPDRPVVTLCGDGGFAMAIHDIGTAVSYQIPTVTIVMNNFCWGSEKAYQKHFYEGRYIGSELVNPDFAKLAALFGAHGQRVETPEEIAPAVEAALVSGHPEIIDVIIDPEELAPLARTDAVRSRLGQ